MSRFASLRQTDVRQQPLPHAPENRQPYAQRDRSVALNPDEMRVMRVVGSFRTVNADDLPDVRLDRLVATKMIQRTVVYPRGVESAISVVTLTPQGRAVLDSQREAGDAQRYWSGLVKPNEVAHDASIYSAYRAEVEAIEKAGGTVRRVVLDYEFKSHINRRMNQPDGPDPDTRRAQLAQEYGLPVVDGKLALPDVRIEYEDADGREQHQDIEITTRHYRGAHAAGKAKAGFKRVRSGSGTPRASVKDDHHHGWAQ